MAIFQGQVGPQVVASGSIADVRMGNQGDGIFSELSPRYYEQVFRGNVFNAVTQTVQTFTAGLTTATGLVFGIQNPPTSGKNMTLVNTAFSLTGTTAAVIGLSVGPYTSVLNTATTTGPTIQNAFAGSPNTSVGRVVSVVATPVVQMVLGGIGTSAVTQATDFVEIGGSIVIAPGCTVAMMASAAQTFWASLTWVETSSTLI